MGTSTVSGPFRSQNGFQQLVNGVWTPVGGGGGGGGVVDVITLVDENGGAQVGLACNSYSQDVSSSTPTGPSAGNIIQLPSMDVGQAVLVNFVAYGGSFKCWALQMPNIAGIDFSYMYNGDGNIVYTVPYGSGASPGVLLLESRSGTPFDPNPGLFFLYTTGSTPFYIARVGNWIAPGFGPIALFVLIGNITGVPVNEFSQMPDCRVYPAEFSN
jgi:hypothetical protein